MIATFNCMTEIVAEFEKVTEVHVRRVQRKLEKTRPGEKPLGTLHDENLKKLWALCDRYDGLAQQHAVAMKFHAETDEQSSELEMKVLRHKALEEIARDIFWTQAKDDIGAAAWTADAGIGLRADWMIVVVAGPRHSLERMLGGIIGLKPEE